MTMATMNIPGFTADASLYETVKDYFVVPTGGVSSRHVVPQIPIGLCTKAAYYCARGYQKWCEIFDRNCEPDL
jgi:hypothetical protein